MQLQPVDLGILSVWRVRLLAVVAPLTIALPLLMWWLPGELRWSLAPLATFDLLAALGYWWWLERLYRSLRFGVDESGIRIERGVWWRSIIALPRARIQHSDVSQGPLQRRFGVATLTFFTAGSVHTRISLPGLAHSDAVALRDSLVGMTESSGV